MVNNAVILQAYYTDDYGEMVDLVRERHQAYADRHGFDYMGIDLRELFGELFIAEFRPTIQDAIPDLLDKYEYIVRIDPDVIIGDMNIDLRTATDNTAAVRFQPNGKKPSGDLLRHEFGGLNTHINIGAVYIKRCDFTVRFVKEWVDLANKIKRSYPATAKRERFYAFQNAYNILYIKEGLPDLDPKWNYCKNRHSGCDNPVVLGYHDYPNYQRKINEMKKDLKRLGGVNGK
jgi:hypothetical protein